ncbi:MAG: DUF1844 domain-containing protein [Chthoniobacterales bacterium]|nr:DUF1844 domain-containing protein [Chthoniobacterales bacterium]
MAEIQTNTQSGELSQRFIEFVMMQAQNAALFLGQIPNPQTGEGEVNLELARMFIDQLSMIQEKTRGNLTNEEGAVLRNTLSNLQMAFVEVSQSGASGLRPSDPVAEQKSNPTPQPASESKSGASSESESNVARSASQEAVPPAAPADSEGESRKKFTKSYGA